MIKAIIFDCFGVIRTEGFDQTYRMFGGDPDKDRVFIEKTMADSNKGIIPSTPPVFSKHLGTDEATWRAAMFEGSVINQDLLNYILELKKTYKTAMLSNLAKNSLWRWFEPGFLDPYFEEIVVSGDIGLAKPEAGVYEYTADKLGVRLDECVFTDDREDYIEGAKSVGMKTILFTSNNQFKQDLAIILKSKLGTEN